MPVLTALSGELRAIGPPQTQSSNRRRPIRGIKDSCCPGVPSIGFRSRVGDERGVGPSDPGSGGSAVHPLASVLLTHETEPNFELLRRAGWSVSSISGSYC